jgi:autophagy-related protein 9
MQTLPWPEIVRLIGEIRKHNPITSLSNGQSGPLADMIGEDHKDIAKKLDAHDVAKSALHIARSGLHKLTYAAVY